MLIVYIDAHNIPANWLSSCLSWLASANEASRTFFIDGMDHTFNVFSGDLTALYTAIDATGEFFAETLK